MDFRRTTRVFARTAVAVALGVTGTIATGGAAQAAVSDCQAEITGISVNGRALTPTAAQPFSDPARAFQYAVTPDDLVKVTFRVTGNTNCTSAPFTLATYKANVRLVEDTAAFHASQVLFDSATGTFAKGGPYSLEVNTPPQTANAPAGATCTNKFLTSRYTDAHRYNGNGGSAASGNQYASTCDGRASQNGNGGGKASGRPCMGCVGNADNKNPRGQRPNGTDANNGYECDGNNGVGKGNPAHTGCSQNGFQIDFHRGGVFTTVPAAGINPNYAYQVGG